MICLATNRNLRQATVPSFIHHEERGALRVIPSPQHWVAMLAALAGQDTSSRSNTLDSVLERQISRQMFPPFIGLAPCFLRAPSWSWRTPKTRSQMSFVPGRRQRRKCHPMPQRLRQGQLPSSTRTCSTTSRRMPWRSTPLSDPQPSRTLSPWPGSHTRQPERALATLGTRCEPRDSIRWCKADKACVHPPSPRPSCASADSFCRTGYYSIIWFSLVACLLAL
jgi:hypothetical protein